MLDLPERMQRHISPEPNCGCWLWTGYCHEKGYGRVNVGGKIRGAHRVVFELLRGKVPDGMVLDHICRVRCCVNPDHMEIVTQRENLKRGEGWVGYRMRQTHCKNGHLLMGDNLIVSKTTGHRKCRICENAYQRKCNHKYDRSRNPKGATK